MKPSIRVLMGTEKTLSEYAEFLVETDRVIPPYYLRTGMNGDAVLIIQLRPQEVLEEQKRSYMN